GSRLCAGGRGVAGGRGTSATSGPAGSPRQEKSAQSDRGGRSHVDTRGGRAAGLCSAVRGRAAKDPRGRGFVLSRISRTGTQRPGPAARNGSGVLPPRKSVPDPGEALADTGRAAAGTTASGTALPGVSGQPRVPPRPGAHTRRPGRVAPASQQGRRSRRVLRPGAPTRRRVGENPSRRTAVSRDAGQAFARPGASTVPDRAN